MKIGEHSIGASLKRVAPESHEGRRQDTINKSNLIPYKANYFGDFGNKLHLDQNEKLIRYGLYTMGHRLCQNWKNHAKSNI